MEKERLIFLESKHPGDCTLQEVRDMAAEVLRLREFARDIRDNYDHDEDAHRHNTCCRKCEAEHFIGRGE